MRTIQARGDTIIEVLFATAVGALVIMAVLTLMNRNLATIQTTIENTIVRQSIDAQADFLRYLADEYKSSPSSPEGRIFAQLISSGQYRLSAGTESATTFGECNLSNDAQGKAFYLSQPVSEASQALELKKYDSTMTPDTYAGPGKGLWIEAIGPDPADNTANYIDFHILACWDAPASSQKATLGTIVRVFYIVGDNSISAIDITSKVYTYRGISRTVAS
jgi:hypothetical protein